MALWITLGLVTAVVLLSLAVPTTRRMWAFTFALSKYAALFVVDKLGLRWVAARATGREYVRMTLPRAARLFCEDMGPTYIKFGQIIGSSAGLFPESFRIEFQKCLDEVRPFDFAEVKETLVSELGEERTRQLRELSIKPIASASIAQVHSAELPDGTRVVIKVQRPHIEPRIKADIKIMRAFCSVLTALFRTVRAFNPVGVVDDLGKTLSEELNFRLEAENLETFNRIMDELGQTEVRAPAPHWPWTTRRVLVMERFDGLRVDQVDEIRARGIDGEGKLIKGMRAWFQSCLLHGFFHGDVHAGNLMLLDDGTIGLLDFGIVGRFDEDQRRQIADYIVSITTRDYAKLADVIIETGGLEGVERGDLDPFIADLEKTFAPLLTTALGDLDYTELIGNLHRVARDHGLAMPSEFVLITKQLLYFDRYARLLAPTLNVFTDPRLIMSLIADLQAARA